MSYKNNSIKERFDLFITAAGETVKTTVDLDKNASVVTGIAITSNDENLLHARGTQGIRINDTEVLPENYESKLIMTGLNVSPNARMIDLSDFPAGNRRVEIQFTDVENAAVGFSPYRVSFYFYSTCA